MFGITLKHSLATVAVATGLLAAAGPASAGVVYNGHAGLGASVYQHNQTELDYVDGTSNTIMFGVRAASETAVIESIGTKYTMFTNDGSPARATVNLRMREADRASGARPCKADQECPDGQSCISLTCQER